MKKSFYAYLSRLKHIYRWSLMRCNTKENVAEHSFDAAIIAHALCLIKNNYFGASLDEVEAVLAALYHETAEAITGDLPTPVKYYDSQITSAYKRIEKQAEQKMLDMLPPELENDLRKYVEGDVDPEIKTLVKAADKICAYIKCLEEKKSGNTEFDKAAIKIKHSLSELDMPEVNYFLDNFLEGYMLTLDELNE